MRQAIPVPTKWTIDILAPSCIHYNKNRLCFSILERKKCDRNKKEVYKWHTEEKQTDATETTTQQNKKKIKTNV